VRVAARVLGVAAAALALLAAAAAFTASPAAGHAALTASVPQAGSSVARSPAIIELTFAEDPDPKFSKVAVLDAVGQKVPGVSAPEAVPGKPLDLRVTLAEPLGTGVYTVNWRTVSAVDGHVESGAFAFGVGATPAPGSEQIVNLGSTSSWAKGLGVGGRWLLYAGLALFVGAASTCLFVFGGRLPPGGVTLSRLALLLAGVGLALMVWSERELVGAPSLLPLFQSPAGQLLLSLAVALALCAAAVVALDLYPARWSLWVLGITGLAAILVHVIAGHADAASSWRYLNLAVQWVHMSAIGIWLGGLAWLLLGIRGMERPERAVAVAAFSRIATGTLVVVLATGLVRGLVEVGSLGALFNTSYGVTLLIKVGLVVILVALGALNHFRWVPALRTRDGAARSFRLNASGELALAAGVLLATALLTGFAPASSAVASTPPASAGVTATGSDYATTMRVTLTASPGVAGRNEYLVRVEGYDSGDPLSGVAAVKLEFSLPDDPSLGTSSLKLGSGSGGTWRGAGMQLSVAGRWRANVVVEQAAGGAAVPLDLDVRAP
jgi:copper transport protein